MSASFVGWLVWIAGGSGLAVGVQLGRRFNGRAKRVGAAGALTALAETTRELGNLTPRELEESARRILAGGRL